MPRLICLSLLLAITPRLALGWGECGHDVITRVAVRLLVETSHTSGQIAGRLYFVSTMGSALGTLATSFYFVLWFEINTILTLLTGALVLMGVITNVAHRTAPQAAAHTA